jgi:hypothetical protein
MGRPWIRNRQTEFGVGLALLVVSFALIWDATDGRGGKAPWWLGPFKPW